MSTKIIIAALALCAAVCTALSPQPSHNGLVAKQSNSPTVYVVIDGYLRPIPDADTYLRIFIDWNCYLVIDFVTQLIPLGPPITSGAFLMKGASSPTVYLVTNGQKRGIVSRAAFDKYCFDWSKIATVPQIVADYVPVGPNIA